MKQYLKLILILAVLLSVITIVEARRPTALADPSEELDAKPIFMMQPVMDSQKIPVSEYMEKTFDIPRNLEIEDAGFLTFALSNEAIKFVPAEPDSPHKRIILPYLLENKAVRDVLKLRRIARQIRFQVLREALSDAPELSEERRRKIERHMSQSIGAPLLITSRSPFPSFVPKPGPSMIPMGAKMFDAPGGDKLGLETAIICIKDLRSGDRVLFSLRDAVRNNTLGLVVAHEVAHAIQFDLYGKLFRQIQRVSTNGHDAPYITDLGLAYIEGWAEAFEAVYGPNNPKLRERDRSKYNISEFLFGRQDPIRRGRYVWSADKPRRSGVLKNGAQLMATEGVIAGLFYDILTHRSINAPFEKCVRTMLTLPMNFMEFINNYVEKFPEDKNVIYRIVLEGTRYATMNAEVIDSYRNYYEHNVAFKQQKISRDVFLKHRNAYRNLAENLFEQAMAGEDIFANVGPQLWIQGKVELNRSEREDLPKSKQMILRSFGKNDNTFTFRLDLNTATVPMFRNVGFREEEAELIVQSRNEIAFFEAGCPIGHLEDILGSEEFKRYNDFFNFAHYDHEKADIIEQYAEQSTILWPEDLQRINLVN